METVTEHANTGNKMHHLRCLRRCMQQQLLNKRFLVRSDYSDIYEPNSWLIIIYYWTLHITFLSQLHRKKRHKHIEHLSSSSSSSYLPSASPSEPPIPTSSLSTSSKNHVTEHLAPLPWFPLDRDLLASRSASLHCPSRPPFNFLQE